MALEAAQAEGEGGETVQHRFVQLRQHVPMERFARKQRRHLELDSLLADPVGTQITHAGRADLHVSPRQALPTMTEQANTKLHNALER